MPIKSQLEWRNLFENEAYIKRDCNLITIFLLSRGWAGCLQHNWIWHFCIRLATRPMTRNLTKTTIQLPQDSTIRWKSCAFYKVQHARGTGLFFWTTRKVCILKIQVRLSMIGLLWPKEIISFLDLELKLIINKICVATRTPADVDWPGKQKHHVMNAFGRKHVWHSRWLNHLQLNIAERRA